MADNQQVRQALKLLFQPGLWRRGPSVGELEAKLSTMFGGEAFTFGSGREALLAILKSLQFKKDEEVIVQGYTCIVVPNAILAAGMTPVYADIERETLNLDLEEVERLITPQTRAVICQHTFGIPAFTKRLRDLCDRHSLILIEDCAHVIPDHQSEEIGQHGDLLFFSFGRDKAVSGVSGGAVVCRNKDICPTLSKLQEDARLHGLVHVKMLLLYPLLYTIAKPLYGIGIGKALLVVASKLRMLVPIVTPREKNGSMEPVLHRMPNACAALALEQLNRLQEINDYRRMLTKYYFEEGTKRQWPLLIGVKPDLAMQKFPLFVEGAERIRQQLKKRNIHLHDGWTGCVICPAASDCDAVGYHDGDDPEADMVGEQILSLPTHPTMKLHEAQRLVALLTPLLSKKFDNEK